MAQCGHETLSPYSLLNHVIGICLHTFFLTPYFAWRATHRSLHVCTHLSYYFVVNAGVIDPRLQKGTNNLARDETYHPWTRKDWKLPDAAHATKMDYKELIEETPLYTLSKLVFRQFM